MASEAIDVKQHGGDLVPEEGVQELGVSRELLARLRELEAENSALALANENQREAYERCLDEVANHVVQALLNQKDLREECLKLKKKVLDLERQNRTLSDLFHKNLHLSSGVPPQLQARLQQVASDSQLGPVEKHPVSPSVGLCTSQGSRERPHGASPTSSSLDALSPFLKKKAQILEVLRKLEEADPLLVCPSSYPPLAGHGDVSLQWKAEHRWELVATSPDSMPIEGVGPAAAHGLEPWATRLLVAQSSLEDLLRWKSVGCGTASESLRAEEVGGVMDLGRGGCGDLKPAEMQLLPPHCCHDLSGPSSSSSSDDSGEQEPGDLRSLEQGSPALVLSSITRKEKDILQDTEPYLSVVIENGICGPVNGDQGIPDVAVSRRRDSESRHPKDGLPNASLSSLSKALEQEVLRELSRVGKSQLAQGNESASRGRQEPGDGSQDLASETPVWEDAEKPAQNPASICSHAVIPQNALSETPNHRQTFISTYISSGCLGAPQAPADTAYKSLAGSLNSTTSPGNSPTPGLDFAPHHGEPRPIPIPSPSKIIKFLKMPSERTQSPSHLRLSPQLTRSSKIPCRNNYEVYHSPVPSRRACRGDESSRCAGKSQMVLDGDSVTAFSVNYLPGSGSPGQCSPVSGRSPGANSSEPFSRQVPRTPNYENVMEVTGHDSTGVTAKLDLPTSSSHLVQDLLRPMRETGASDVQPPASFSLPAGPPAPVEKGSQGEGTDQCISGNSLSPSTPEQNLQPKLPQNSSTSLPATPVSTNGSSPAPKKAESGKKLLETPAGHLPFQVRLTALGKLKGAESPQPMAFTQAEGKEDSGADRDTQVTANNQRNRVLVARPCEMSESPLDCTPEARAYLKRSLGSKSLKQADVCLNGEPRVKCYQSRAEADNYSSRNDHCARHRVSPGSPQASRASGRAPGAGNASKHTRSPHGSPTKQLPKSPLKTSAPRLPLNEEQKSSPLPPEEKLKVHQFSMSRRSMTCPEYPARTPPAPRSVDKLPLSSTLHSAIEEKVMKGIEENMLRLQEQDRVPVVEVKQKNSSGIASWFGLKKSKLPALNRRPDALKGKEEKRGVAVASPRKEGRAAAKKLEVESLNISMLMEKAEDLRKALEAEKAYVKGRSAERTRAPPGGIIVEQTQSELKVIYSKEVTPDNFMRQLLNRVDGSDLVYENPLDLKSQLPDFPRVTRESKEAQAFRSQRNGLVSHLQHCEQIPDQAEDVNIREEVPSDDSLTESVTSQHFTVCGSLTRTLDSGIGTFPPPDYCSGTPSRSVPRLKPGVEAAPVAQAGRPPALLKLPRKARTLEREVPSMEEALVPGQHHSVPAFHALLANAETALGQRVRGVGKDPCGSPAQVRRTQQGKNWTFPNVKAAVGSADTFLSGSRELAVLHGSARGSADGRMECDLPNLTPHAPLVFPGSIASRTPSASDVGEEGAIDLKSRGGAQMGLESSESLSDSLYDSLSSCGSQG